jgi:hypothetical protein
MEMSFDIKTSSDYEIRTGDYSALDLAYMNPSNEKQHVSMKLLENGRMDMTIEKIDFEGEIKIPHKLHTDDSRTIMKTEIVGNTINFYTKTGKLLKTSFIELPNRIDIVNKIKSTRGKFAGDQINQIIASIQGQHLEENTNEFLKTVTQDGAQIVSENEQYARIRMSMSKRDARLDKEVEVLVDKHKKLMIESIIYSPDNQVLQKTCFGYSKGEQQYLRSIRKEQSLSLPSGKKVKKIRLSKIDNFKINI